MTHFRVAIIGAGIAGASVAAEIGAHCNVLLVEAEEHPGYHATGRSAAFWTESYGGPDVQPLTAASYPLLATPPASFAEHGFLTPRGALHIGTTADEHAALDMQNAFAASDIRIDRVDPAFIGARIPGVKDVWQTGLWEPSCSDIDVACLHQSYLAAAKRAGVRLAVRAPVRELKWMNGAWHLSTNSGAFTADIIVNAAGAWADAVASRAGVCPLDIRAFRRTMIQLQVSPEVPSNLPLVIGLDGSFYFKPAPGGRVWLSPHDEIPSDACDVVPDEIDVATAIARLQQVVDWHIERVEHRWAGLRSFAPDRLPVIGFARDHPAFFWLAGQGGFGIQTAPAISQIAAAQLLDKPASIVGVDPERYSPNRFA